MNKKTYIQLGIIAVLLASLFFTFNGWQKSRKKIRSQEDLYNAVTDSLVSFKDKDSLNTSKIRVIMTEKNEAFYKLNNLKGVNLELQNLVKRKNKEIKDLNTALVMESETKITDTLKIYYPIQGDTIVFSEGVLLDTLKNDWIDAKYGFNRGFSYLDLSIRNKYELTIGYEGRTIFKRGVPYAEIRNLNPYTETKEMRVYQLKTPPPRKYGISIQAGFGGVYDIKEESLGYGPYIGLGINYNILQW